MTRHRMALTLDVDVTHDAVTVERHHLRLAIGPGSPEPRTVHAGRRLDLFAADVATLQDDRLPERQEGLGVLRVRRAEREAGRVTFRRHARAPEPPGGRGRWILPPHPHGHVTCADRDHRRTADPVVRAGERVGVRARRGERQQVAALDVGWKDDVVGEHVSRLAMTADHGHGLVGRTARA